MASSAQGDRLRIAVVIPCYNDGATLPEKTTIDLVAQVSDPSPLTSVALVAMQRNLSARPPSRSRCLRRRSSIPISIP